ncbi:MAG: hypothetical protein NXH88_07200 [Hyphomonas sp.]|nr:hypothetical protein [Hyphomonas sp.]
MALPFLRGETEENATQTLAFVSIVIVTIGLAIFNVCGAIAGSQSESALEIVIRGAFGLVITGAEFLAAVALVRVMLAKNRLRKVVGTIIFVGLAWVCIQNGKRAAHLIFPEFAQSAALLEAKAGIAEDEAKAQKTARDAAIAATPAELERVRARIADLRLEQQLMASQSPEKIAEAQALLISQGKYFWEVDGLRGPETERAMRARGEEIRQELDRLSLREESLSAGVASATALVSADGEVNTGNLSAAAQQAVLADQARQARQAAIWIEIMLWVVEGARSFGLWALVTTITAKDQKDPTRSEAAKQGWQTRKEKEEAEREQLKIDDGPYWSLKIIKALNNGMPKRTVKGTMRTFFSNMEPNAVKLRLTRLMDARLELPKGYYKDGNGNVKRADRAIERGFLSEDRKTYLMQEHIDYILMEGEYAPKKKDDKKPKQEPNGKDHSTDVTIPELGHDDVDRPAA